ncbi:hypothetical protein ACFQ9U_09575 [Streptomyces sp. NPDC056568]|uniref:hypothetical protein n=1 Tax=Streptomyces sp. NPDC056568 TaxID=3345866 RepID=UPI0036B445FB
MRLFTTASPCLVAAAALLAVTASAVPAHADPQPPLPACTAPDDHTFPLTTRIHGGPTGFEAGGGYGTWYLDLTNTTSRTCEGIHPVVVLVDEERALKPSQPRLEFYDGAQPRPVAFESTERDELIGVFGEAGGEGAAEGEGAGEGAGEAEGGGGDAAGEGAGLPDFPGFTVGPGKTLTVKVRLALTSDAVANEVTANAAVVQRRGGDGEWIGQSDDYRFRIRSDRSAAEPSAGRSADPASPSGEAAPESRGPATPDASGTGTPDEPTEADGTDRPRADEARDGQAADPPYADQLAGTGPGRTGVAAALAALLVAAGGGAVLLARRRR